MSLKKVHPVDIFVGQKLRQLRCLKGLSQQQLGDLLGLTFQQIQKYERGMNRLSCSRVYEAAKHLSVPIPYFFEGYESDQQGALVTADIALRYSKTTIQLVQAYHQLGTPHIQKSFMLLLRAVAKQQDEDEGGE